MGQCCGGRTRAEATQEPSTRRALTLSPPYSSLPPPPRLGSKLRQADALSGCHAERVIQQPVQELRTRDRHAQDVTHVISPSVDRIKQLRVEHAVKALLAHRSARLVSFRNSGLSGPESVDRDFEVGVAAETHGSRLADHRLLQNQTRCGSLV